MNAASISWGDDPYIQLTVRNAEELASALDRATAERNVDSLPFLIDVSDQDVSANGTSAPVGLQIGIGTDRAKVFWMGADSGVGYQPGVPPEKGQLAEFDYGGVPSEETLTRCGSPPPSPVRRRRIASPRGHAPHAWSGGGSRPRQGVPNA